MLKSEFVYFQKSLMISQGLSVSNGGTGLRGDASRYFHTLNLMEPFLYAPSKAMLVENGIFEDFLRSAHILGRFDLIERWDRTSYYVKCFSEVSEKRSAGIVGGAEVDGLQREVENALDSEPLALQARVRSEIRNGGSTRQVLRRVLPAALISILRPLILRLKGAKPSRSVLQAAGFAEQP